VSAGPVLDVRDLSVSYRLSAYTVEAVKRASLLAAPGERIGLVGESGSGKTTLALALMGMLKAPGQVTGGTAVLNGVDLLRLGPRQHAAMRLRHVAYIPQGAMNSLNPVIRIRQSFAHLYRDHGIALSPEEFRERAAALLDMVGLPATTLDRYPHELSGGMKQRVCIAMGISQGPSLIIADEPTSALDVVTQRQVMQTFERVQSALGSAAIVIGHDMGLMAQSVDALVIMKRGVIVEQGPVRETFKRPRDQYTRQLIASVPTLAGEPVVEPPVTSEPEARHGKAAPLIAFRGVGKVYPSQRGGADPVVALQPLDMSLSIDEPRLVAIVGQSGSGKSTLASLALGFTSPSTGEIVYRGKPMSSFDARETWTFRREVQAVFQDPFSTFNPFYRVERALSLPLFNFRIARNRDEARQRMIAACEGVGLDGRVMLERFPHQLSGGERQRLMVARALMLEPKLLIADEPVSMVDASMRAAILDLLLALRRDHGISILYITHDLATAYRVSDMVLVLRRGRLVEAGPPSRVLHHPTHPYTRLLIESIPWPDPDRHWSSADDEAATPGLIDDQDRHPEPVSAHMEGFAVSTAQ
jgi:peptide/nickel transport system ATP-binding protein